MFWAPPDLKVGAASYSFAHTGARGRLQNFQTGRGPPPKIPKGVRGSSTPYVGSGVWDCVLPEVNGFYIASL